MQTIQFSVGEAIEAMYEELLETYGDEELARAVGSPGTELEFAL